jgi:hypothetical protein
MSTITLIDSAPLCDITTAPTAGAIFVVRSNSSCHPQLRLSPTGRTAFTPPDRSPLKGKAASSRNATRHGLTSKQIVLPGEDAAEYDEVRHDLIDTYAPANANERILVEELAASSWRLMRARRQETAILAKIAEGTQNPDLAIAAFFLEKPKDVARLTRYIASFERAYYRAQSLLDKLRKERCAAERRQALTAATLNAQRNPARAANVPSAPIGFVSQNRNTPEDAPTNSDGDNVEVRYAAAGR